MSGAVEGVALLPCPFCGGEASAEGRVRYTDNHEAWFADGSRVLEAFYCNCVKCGASRQNIVGGYQTRELAVIAWNTRTTPPARSYADGVADILRTAQADCGCRIPSPFDEVAEHAIGLALATVSQGEKA